MISYVACRFGTTALSASLAWIVAALVWSHLVVPQAYGYTLTVFNARAILRTTLASALVVVATLCSPLLGVLWPTARVTGPTRELYLRLGLATPAAVPCLISVVNSITGHKLPERMYGHEDLSFVKQAYAAGFALAAVAHLIHLVTVPFSQRPLWIGHMPISIAALVLVILNCLWNAPSRHLTITFKVRFCLVTAAWTALFGPGAAAAVLWLWREDKVRCRLH